jgi:hypothetical protein
MRSDEHLNFHSFDNSLDMTMKMLRVLPFDSLVTALTRC